MLVTLVALLSSATVAQAEQGAASQPPELNRLVYAELLRSDVRAQKITILTQVIGFTEADDAAFWPT